MRVGASQCSALAPPSLVGLVLLNFQDVGFQIFLCAGVCCVAANVMLETCTVLISPGREDA